MEKGQKPRRPRIGEARGAASREGGNEKYEKVNYTRRNDNDNDYNYNRRPYNNDNRNYNRRNDNYGGGNHYQRNYNADNNTAGTIGYTHRLFKTFTHGHHRGHNGNDRIARSGDIIDFKRLSGNRFFSVIRV